MIEQAATAATNVDTLSDNCGKRKVDDEDLHQKRRAACDPDIKAREILQHRHPRELYERHDHRDHEGARKGEDRERYGNGQPRRRICQKESTKRSIKADDMNEKQPAGTVEGFLIRSRSGQ